tara:strand:- start:1655 stop:1906 length:252 start_codon:yes stop_codon:yes gene_type:complete
MTIKLYTSSNCPACVTLKGRLEGLGLKEYEEANVNIASNREDVVKLGFRGVPVLVRYDTDGQVVGVIIGALGADTAYTDLFTP